MRPFTIIAEEGKMPRVYLLKEVRSRSEHPEEEQLCLQWCRFESDDGVQYGYRFISRAESGAVRAVRGQTRIANLEEVSSLIDKATQEGWGNRNNHAMQWAADELRALGCVVDFATGYVNCSKTEAAQSGVTSTHINELERIIREWT